jgi:glycosyltransferase involved in cell wall biosynthesis
MISVLIPAHNETERIGATLAAVRKLPDVTQIIVIDDGSQDDTARVAEMSGADVVLRQPNAGKGAALQAGLELASCPVLLLLDADLGETAGEASKLIAPILEGRSDMTIATFPVRAGKGGGVGLVVKLSRWGIRKLTGRTMTAPLSGQRAVRRDVILDCGGFASGWGVEVALTVGALRQGYRVLEVPTQMTHRVTGRSLSAILHRGAQFAAAARVLLRLWRPPIPSPARKTAAPAVADTALPAQKKRLEEKTLEDRTLEKKD